MVVEGKHARLSCRQAMSHARLFVDSRNWSGFSPATLATGWHPLLLGPSWLCFCSMAIVLLLEGDGKPEHSQLEKNGERRTNVGEHCERVERWCWPLSPPKRRSDTVKRGARE